MPEKQIKWRKGKKRICPNDTNGDGDCGQKTCAICYPEHQPQPKIWNINYGSNMTTFSGRYVNPADLQLDEIDIEDIAHGLSNICRFAGQFALVSNLRIILLLLAWMVFEESKDKDFALTALLHDAPEAYVCDLVRCVKKFCPDYRRLEQMVWHPIVRKFNLRCIYVYSSIPSERKMHIHPRIKEADMRMLVTERRQLISDKSAVWDLETKYLPYEIEIDPAPPKMAKAQFLQAFKLFSDPTSVPSYPW
jgi:hypothetical protein